jgi:hypothetical protein
MSLPVRSPRKPLHIGLPALLSAALLAGCGGGGGGGASPSQCSVEGQQAWLFNTMDDTYFWTAYSPKPAAEGFADVASYLQALLYTGTDSRFPADRWSYTQSTADFNRFFTDGATMGFGVAVAGRELARDSTKPLLVRYVDPGSPAAAAGLQRGDRLTQMAGRAASDVVASDDYSALTAGKVGDTLLLAWTRSGVAYSATITASSYALVPVTGAAVLQSAGGRKFGYLAVKDMVSQALAPADTAFAQFKAAGVADVVLDLRYNGGGLVSTGATLASYLAGSRGTGLNYASLIYNDKHTASNSSFAFRPLGAALDLPRVLVLMGRRTCSASEQVINGLRGAGLTVVAIGEPSCGKPVGFQPVAHCDTTYSLVNFESVNQLGQGRYFNGFTPTCAVAEDFSAPMASAADPLMAAATAFVDSGSCPAASSAPSLPTSLRHAEPGERRGMLAR